MVKRAPKTPADKPTQGDLTHTLSNSAGQLLSFVQRYERMSEEIQGLTEDRKEIMGEAKASGYDTATLRREIALRKLDKDDRQEREAMGELYRETIDKAEAAERAQSVEDGE